MTESITVIGNTNLDIMVGDTFDLPAPGTERVVPSIAIRLGGSAGNLALRCAGLNIPTTLISRVGDDSSVSILQAELEHPFLAAHLMRTPAEVSGVSVAVEAPGRDRSFISSLGAMALMGPCDVEDRMLCATYVALAGYFVLPGMRGAALLELFGRARDAGAMTVVDTGWPPEGWTHETRQEVMAVLGAVDLFLPNEDELCGLTGGTDAGRAAREVAAATNTLVVVKRGARGAALAAPDGTWIEQEARPIQVVDSTGAGDGFNAALLVSMARGLTWGPALARAVAYATEMVATEPGLRRSVTLATDRTAEEHSLA